MDATAVIGYLAFLALPAAIAICSHGVMIVLDKRGQFMGYLLLMYLIFPFLALSFREFELFAGYSAIFIALIQIYKWQTSSEEVLG